MPHGKIWTGYVMGSCKEWCSETIEGIFADSLEDYKLFQQEKLTPGLGKELEDMIVEYFASIDKMPLLKRIKRKILNTQIGIELDRNARMHCDSCGHYYHATNLLAYGLSYWPPELHEKWHRATCPYCGESNPEYLWHRGYGHRIELEEILKGGKK